MMNNFERSWGRLLETLPADHQEAALKLMAYYAELVQLRKGNVELQNEPAPHGTMYRADGSGVAIDVQGAQLMAIQAIDDLLPQVAVRINQQLQQAHRWI